MPVARFKTPYAPVKAGVSAQTLRLRATRDFVVTVPKAATDRNRVAAGSALCGERERADARPAAKQCGGGGSVGLAR